MPVSYSPSNHHIKRFKCGWHLGYICLVTCLVLPIQAAGVDASQGALATGHKQLSLEAIFLAKSKRVAVIDGKYYIQGDQTAMGEIAAILHDRIVLIKDGQMIVLFPTMQQKHA